MFAKLLPRKAMPQHNDKYVNMAPADVNLQVPVHYGIPYTASIIAFDHVQRLLAIGTLDGRIKIIGGENIEGLLIAPKKLPYKFMEFLCNQGFLVGVSNDNEIQVWDMENRCLTCSLQWDCNVTAFSVIQGTGFMYSGDENGLTSVFKFDAEKRMVLQMPYYIPVKSVEEASSISFSNHMSVVGILTQPCTLGKRVLIAYDVGVMIIWDIADNHVVTVRGHTHLHLKADANDDSSCTMADVFEGLSESDYYEEKEICSLCWVSAMQPILAVGYIDGDILLWDLSSSTHLEDQHSASSSNNVVKLQLSSGERRLPVIILHWSADSKLDNGQSGLLFVYGGDEMGSEEVLTVLSLHWSAGIHTVRCVARVGLTLHGSFADMLLIRPSGVIEDAPAAAVLALTNPGQLHLYDILSLSDKSPLDEEPAIRGKRFPTVIPITDPCMNAAKLCLLPAGDDLCKNLLKKASYKRKGETPMDATWPLTGGVPSELSSSEDFDGGMVYIAGYRDGSIRVWDATSPIFTSSYVIEGKVNRMELPCGLSPISAVDFSFAITMLAVGSENGLVYLYKLCGNDSADNYMFHFVTESNHEVHNMQHKDDFYCTAIFSVSNSAVTSLHFAKSGDKIAVGFQCGRVSMLNTSSMSVLFMTDSLSLSGSPIISMDMKLISCKGSLIHKPEHSSPSLIDVTDALFILAKNSHVLIVDSISGSILNPQPVHSKMEPTAVAMYVIDGKSAAITGEKICQVDAVHSESGQIDFLSRSYTQGPEPSLQNDSLCSQEVSSDSVLLLCLENALKLCSLKSVMQGDNKTIHKVNLSKSCCWSTITKSKDEKIYGLLLLYRTGELEIRSLPDLEVVEESSLMSILRWTFKTNMDKTMCSSEDGNIALVNGSELAVISILACVNNFRVPESLPTLHDKVLAAAADAARNLSIFQKKKQASSTSILTGLVKGFKRGKNEHSIDVSEGDPRCNVGQQLDSYFSRTAFCVSMETPSQDQELDLNPSINEDLELNIDDIDIDEDIPGASTSSHIAKHDRTLNEDIEREKLFQGAKIEVKPRRRTPEEILTQYKFAGDASAAASHARDKLAQRQEKLQKAKERAEELRHGAENFASMANELVKTMEAKKWWKL